MSPDSFEKPESELDEEVISVTVPSHLSGFVSVQSLNSSRESYLLCYMKAVIVAPFKVRHVALPHY